VVKPTPPGSGGRGNCETNMRHSRSRAMTAVPDGHCTSTALRGRGTPPAPERAVLAAPLGHDLTCPICLIFVPLRSISSSPMAVRTVLGWSRSPTGLRLVSFHPVLTTPASAAARNGRVLASTS
jgi:hypothetical protein